MVVTIESLPSEVLEIIFSKLSGLPQLPLPGWAMLDEVTWTDNLKNVHNLSRTSKRFYSVGRHQRETAAAITDHTQTLPWTMEGGWNCSALTQLSVSIPFSGYQGFEVSHGLGSCLHTLTSLQHLHACFAALDETEILDCCGSDYDFFQAIANNLALDHHRLRSFRYSASSDCHHLCQGLWETVTRLAICELALDSGLYSLTAKRCPSVRRLSIAALDTFHAENDNKCWSVLKNLEELWIFDHTGLSPASWKGVPDSLHTIGVTSCETAVFLALLDALQEGKMEGLRHLSLGLPCRSAQPEPCPALLVDECVVSEIGNLLEQRGGKADTWLRIMA